MASPTSARSPQSPVQLGTVPGAIVGEDCRVERGESVWGSRGGKNVDMGGLWHAR
jgi:hypothetical protein